MTDPIADALTRIRNGYLAKHISVELPYSKMKEGLLDVLEKFEFIDTYSADGDGIDKKLTVLLAYNEDGSPRVEKIQRVSRPSLRRYIKSKDIGLTRGGFGITILSTSKGLMAAHEAKKEGLGGEVLATIW